MKLRILPKTRLETLSCTFAVLLLAIMVLVFIFIILGNWKTLPDQTWATIGSLIFLAEPFLAILTVGCSLAAFFRTRERPLLLYVSMGVGFLGIVLMIAGIVSFYLTFRNWSPLGGIGHF